MQQFPHPSFSCISWEQYLEQKIGFASVLRNEEVQIIYFKNNANLAVYNLHDKSHIGSSKAKKGKGRHANTPLARMKW